MASVAPSTRSSVSPRTVLLRLGLLAVLGVSLGAVGCIDHLNNARVRGADEFECKRAEVEVTQVADHVFVARGCDQVGAYRCEAGLEGGCKKIQGKTGDKYIAMAPEASPEDGEKPKKKKKKASDAEGEGDAEKTEKKPKDDDKPPASSKKDEGETSSKATKDEVDPDAEKPKKKKKKKSEDE